MTDTTRIPKAELTGVYGGLLKRMSRKHLGAVAEPLEVLWHNRKVLGANLRLARKVQSWGDCDEGLKSLAQMAVSALVGCTHCMDLGYWTAHTRGLDEARVREVLRWRDSDAFTPLERNVLEYAEAMTQTPPAVTDELSARLLAALGAPALVELTGFVATMNSGARTNVALGITSQGFSAACGLPPLPEPNRREVRATA